MDFPLQAFSWVCRAPVKWLSFIGCLGQGWRGACAPKVREVLREVSREVLREVLREVFFARALVREVLFSAPREVL